MRKEMTCIFNCDIDEELRKELAEGKLREHASSAASHNLRGIAMLELCYLDIELNINALEDEDDNIEEATPACDYFICIKCGDTEDPWEWESFGYADDYIGDLGHAEVDWSAENWKELLFKDMLVSLTAFYDEAKVHQKNLTFLSANERVF